VRLTSKGQVTIPQPIRERLGLVAGSEVEFVVEGDAVRLRKSARPARVSRGRAIVEHTRGRGNRRFTTEQLMKLLRG
jgi:AbrB family looped-hinge helix DNA binding protein